MKPFSIEELLDCYQRGVFPMADSREDDGIFLIDPAERGVLPLGGFHIPRRLARTVRSDVYQVRVDTAFNAVVEACAAARPDRPDTWINHPIQGLYRELFMRGYGHSVECWLGPHLVGGLYGVALGAAFFGESMFSLERDASKVALVHLVARLKVGGFHLLDAQFLTDHLSQFGAVAVPRAAYKKRLMTALERQGDFYLMPAGGAGLGTGVGPAAEAGGVGASVLQAISQAS